MSSICAVIPVYNVEKYLRRCLDSIEAQTRKFDEIIIVNDGSTDNCPRICESYAAKNPHITIINKKNGGLVSAWMEALKYVTSDYICFIDSDDYVSQDYLMIFENALDPSIDMVCMNCMRHFDDGRNMKSKICLLDAGTYKVDMKLKSKLICDEGNTYRLIAGCRWAKIIKTSLVLKYSEYCSEKISYGEDQQLTVGLFLGSKYIRIIDEYKYYYQYNENSIINTYKEELWEKVNLLINTIRLIPDIKSVSNSKCQLNTQFLMYCNDCLKNEYYFGKYSREYFLNIAKSKEVNYALKCYCNKKMRRLDILLLKCLINKKYIYSIFVMKVYWYYCKVKKVPM